MEHEISSLTLQQKESEDRQKADREEFDKLKRWIVLNGKKQCGSEAAAKEAAVVHEGDEDSADETKMITEAERIPIEESMAMVASNMMKVSLAVTITEINDLQTWTGLDTQYICTSDGYPEHAAKVRRVVAQGWVYMATGLEYKGMTPSLSVE